jgi:2-phosphosulfolactate phosphatase
MEPLIHRCRLEWGRRGAAMAAERGDVLVVVDTLSFSTAVATAIHHGLVIYPRSHGEDAEALARRVGAEVAVRREEVPARGRFSLSPGTYERHGPGTRVVLASPNGATCARYGRSVPLLLVGALVNAEAVAGAVAAELTGTEGCVTVLACGERWETPSDDGDLRFALEDYLGAGAILSYVPYEKTPEARVCEAAFLHSRDELDALLWDCESGRDLRERGFGDDVRRAARLNDCPSVPVLRGDRLERW